MTGDVDGHTVVAIIHPIANSTTSNYLDRRYSTAVVRRILLGTMDPTPPPAAAATKQDSDEILARKWAAMEQLTQAFGFELGAAKQAIDVVGPDVEAACAFILDQGLGQDGGGPVVPIDNCPHLETHFQFSPSQLEASFDPSSTVCSHFHNNDNEDSNNSSHSEKKKVAATGKPKVDVDSETGSCISNENWLCLECGALRCSRYVNGHSLVHWETTKANDTAKGEPKVGHCVALSLSDLSVWCYECSAYLHHPTLSPILQKVEDLKFKMGDSNDQGKISAQA